MKQFTFLFSVPEDCGCSGRPLGRKLQIPSWDSIFPPPPPSAGSPTLGPPPPSPLPPISWGLPCPSLQSQPSYRTSSLRFLIVNKIQNFFPFLFQKIFFFYISFLMRWIFGFGNKNIFNLSFLISFPLFITIINQVCLMRLVRCQGKH